MEQKRFRSRDPRETIFVAPRHLEEAFEHFKDLFEPHEKPSEHDMYKAFHERLCRLLEMVSLGDVTFDFPKSKTSWQRKVKTLPDDARIKLPLAVCQQIYVLTSVELTPANANIRVASAPINSTDMVTLGEVIFTPDEDDQAAGEVGIDWLQINASDPKIYKRADFDGAAANGGEDYARVVYYLEGASIKLVGAPDAEALLDVLSDGETTDNGTSKSLELVIDSREEITARWNVTCPRGRLALEGLFSKLRLARIETRQDDLRVEVSVDPHQIDPDIKRLDDDTVTRAERSTFRKNMERQIFRQRIRDEGRITRFLVSTAYATPKMPGTT